MENIDERLRLLEQTGCTVSGFTVNNAAQEQFERFIELFAKADSLEQFNLTELENFSEIPAADNKAKGEWLKRRERSLKYRLEHKIEMNEAVVRYFYSNILPQIIKILPKKQRLKKLYMFNIMLTEEQIAQVREIFENHPSLAVVEFGNLHLHNSEKD